MIKYFITPLFVCLHLFCQAQVDDAKVYWVGHSLMSSTDRYNPGTVNLIRLMDDVVSSQDKSYAYHKHTTPGAPIGWNWGGIPRAWDQVQERIQPLLDTGHSDYGTFDVMVVTEQITLKLADQYWHSSFYLRKFFKAAQKANPNTRFFFYESWHNYQAVEDNEVYGAYEDFDWRQFMIDTRATWDRIADEASDPTKTKAQPDNYVYSGPGNDINLGDDILKVNIIPTGTTLVRVLDRLKENRSEDDWTFQGRMLRDIDFFLNPLANSPTDRVTPVRPDNPIDDIHPSHILTYLNALVHYSVIYQDNPQNIPAANGVPDNIADIFKKVVWDVVRNDARTGVINAALPVTFSSFQADKLESEIQLTWTTEMEMNNDRFEIERSYDGFDFMKIGKVKSKGNSSTEQEYSFIDTLTLSEPTVYYRIKQIDLDGKGSYSDIISIALTSIDRSIRNDVSIYPNPIQTGEILAISTTGNKDFNLYNLHGQSVRVQKHLEDSTWQINTRGLQAGYYIIKFTDGTIRKILIL